MRLSGAEAERTILLFVGRLAKETDVDALLPAVRDGPGVAPAIVDDGPLRERLERAFAGTRTTFTGMLAGRDLAAAYASADVFVFPSQTETPGLVLLEARAAGLPVVAADSAAARALVRHGRDGMLFDPGDPSSLRRAVAVLAADRGRRTAIGLEAGRPTADATPAQATRALRGPDEAARAASPPGGAADAWAARDGAPPGGGPDPAPRSIP